jgi:hypothetical protein
MLVARSLPGPQCGLAVGADAERAAKCARTNCRWRLQLLERCQRWFSVFVSHVFSPQCQRSCRPENIC